MSLRSRIDVLLKGIFQVNPEQPNWRFFTGVAEEAGEAIGAYNRYTGRSRRTGTKEELAEELADVVITAYMAAAVTDIDLDTAIADKCDKMEQRGWGSKAEQYND